MERAEASAAYVKAEVLSLTDEDGTYDPDRSCPDFFANPRLTISRSRGMMPATTLGHHGEGAGAMTKDDALRLAQEIATGLDGTHFEVEGFTFDHGTGYALILSRVHSDQTFELRSLVAWDGCPQAAEITEEWRRQKQTGFRMPTK